MSNAEKIDKKKNRRKCGGGVGKKFFILFV